MRLALLCILGISSLASRAHSMLVPLPNCLPVSISGNPSNKGHCNLRHCLTNGAHCRKKVCRCLSPLVGDGSIFCAPENRWRCSVVNDPIVRAFTRERFEVIAPCRSLMAQFTAFLPSKDEWTTQGSKYFVQIYTYCERNYGKINVGGWDMKATLFQYGLPDKFFEFRAFAGIDNAWQFQPQINIMGTWYNHTSYPDSELSFAFHLDENNKRMIFSLYDLGLEIALRPSHPKLGVRQGWTPGFYISIDPSVGDFDWTGHRDTICRAPPSEATVNMSSEATHLGLDTRTQAAFRLTFKLPNQKNESFIPERCGYVAEKLDECSHNSTRRAVAVKKCMPLMKEPLFMKCMSLGDNTHGFPNMVALLHMCVEAICNQDVTMCNVLVDDVTRSCEGMLPSSWTLTNSDCNKMPLTTFTDDAPF